MSAVSFSHATIFHLGVEMVLEGITLIFWWMQAVLAIEIEEILHQVLVDVLTASGEC